MSVVPFRSLVGPLLAAAAVWAAAGALALADASGGSARIAVLASPWWLAGGFVAALCVPAWRRSPALASPMLLTVLPWLPVPLPTALLFWTGHLAWVPVGLALLAALMAQTHPARQRATVAASARTHALVAGLLTLAAGALVLGSVHGRLPGGDEPHYLVITQSLLADGDLRIENNHAARDYAAYWGGDLAPHFVQRGQDGAIYSIHAPGVSVIVAPLFALFGLAGAQWTILLLSSVTGALVWLTGWYATGDRTSAWFAWAALIGSVTMLAQSVTIFPDGPGAMVMAAAAVVWVRVRRGDTTPMRWVVGLSLLLAALPFLHTRLVVLAAGMGFAVATALWQARAGTPGDRVRRVAMFFVAPMVGAVVWFGYFQEIYGTPNPMAPYGANDESRFVYVPGGMAGLLFDQQFGLFTYAPVLLLAVVAWGRRWRNDAQRWLWPLAAVAGTYLAAVSTYWMWWAGVPGTPARLATSCLPLLAAPLAVFWYRGRASGRVIALVLLATSLAISVRVLGFDVGDLAWSSRDAHAAWLEALGTVVDLPRAWPSFFWRLVGGEVASEAAFFLHVGLWVAVVSAVLQLARVLFRWNSPHEGTGTRQRVSAVWALTVAVMLAAQTGWWLNGVPGVRPAVAQLALLRRVAAGGRPVSISSLRIAPVSGAAAALRVTVPRTDLPGDRVATWATLRQVPAGTYDLWLTSRRPAGGTLIVRSSVRAAVPFERFDLPVRSRHIVAVTLPVDVPDLAVVPDESLAAGEGELILVPRTLAPGRYEPALSVLRVDGLDVYLLDTHAFVEGSEFWVAGGATARTVVVAPDRAARILAVTLANGPESNAVVVLVNSQPQRLLLGPGEQRVVEVAVGEAGPVELSVSSAAGFRPSERGPSDDSRYLGVRVRLQATTGTAPSSPADQ